MTMAQGGTVLEVSASRVVYEGPNNDLNEAIFDNLFLKDSDGNRPRMGDVMLTATQSYTDVTTGISFVR